MAMSTVVALQTCFLGAAPCISPVSHRLAFGGLRVRCQAKKSSEQKPPVSQTTEPAQLQTPTPSTASKPKPKVSRKFSDIFAFSGPAPERINGRLAMIGFVSAVTVEAARGQDLVQQITNGGVPWFFYVTALLTAASLVPLFRGERAESKTGGLMSPEAELWNGRFAMLGLVALAFTEYVNGGPIV